MGGPFMQSIVLMGIIYWYSKGMLNLINDYYRSEFNQKLKKVPPEQKIQSHSYDLDDMEELINIESLKDTMAVRRHQHVYTDVNVDECSNESAKYMTTLNDVGDSRTRCYRVNSKQEFLNLLLRQYCPHVRGNQVDTSFNYPVCLLNENLT